jgi:hypothetical protein
MYALDERKDGIFGFMYLTHAMQMQPGWVMDGGLAFPQNA